MDARNKTIAKLGKDAFLRLFHHASAPSLLHIFSGSTISQLLRDEGEAAAMPCSEVPLPPRPQPPHLLVPDTEILDFGIHKGKTFRKVWEMDRNYCNYVESETRQGRSTCPMFERLARYTTLQELWMEHQEELAQEHFKRRREAALEAAQEAATMSDEE